MTWNCLLFARLYSDIHHEPASGFFLYLIFGDAYLSTPHGLFPQKGIFLFIFSYENYFFFETFLQVKQKSSEGNATKGQNKATFSISTRIPVYTFGTISVDISNQPLSPLLCATKFFYWSVFPTH